MKRFATNVIPILMVLAAPAVGQTSSDATGSKKSIDPNKVVCHTEEVTGSLLATKRECHTNAEWQEMQRQQRADLDQAQSQRGR